MQSTSTSTLNKRYKWSQGNPQRLLSITLILLLAATLFIYQLGDESLWVDELYSIDDAKAIPERLPYIRPVYFSLLSLWMHFGSTEAWLRGLSVLFALASVLLIYQLGRRVAGESVGLIAALMLSVSPLFINFAQMVRMYSLATCLGIAGTLAFVDALTTPTNRSLAIWAITRALMLLSAPLNAPLLFTDILLCGWHFRQRRSILWRFARWLLLIIGVWLPFLFSLVTHTIPFISNAANVSAKFDSASARHSFPSAVDVLRKLRNFTAFPFPSTSKLMSGFYQAYTLMLTGLLGFALGKKHRSPQLIWIAAWTFVPAITIFFVSKRLWIDRYMLFIAPYVLILLAAGWQRLWRWQRGWALVVAIIYTIAVTGGVVRYYTVQDRQDWRGIAQTISTYEQPGDTIILSGGSPSPKMESALTHYYSGAAPIIVSPEICPNAKVAPPNVEAAWGNLPPIPSRLWLLCGEDFGEQKFQALLGEHLQVQTHSQFRNENFYRQDDFLHLFLAQPHAPSPEKTEN